MLLEESLLFIARDTKLISTFPMVNIYSKQSILILFHLCSTCKGGFTARQTHLCGSTREGDDHFTQTCGSCPEPHPLGHIIPALPATTGDTDKLTAMAALTSQDFLLSLFVLLFLVILFQNTCNTF